MNTCKRNSLRSLRTGLNTLKSATMVAGIAASAALLAACGGGGGGGSSRSQGATSANTGCDGFCEHQLLTEADVAQILQQAIAGAESLGAAANIAITDRVGNVLATYSMPGAPATTVVDGQIGAVGGLEGLAVPAIAAAISKAGTGAFLSSQGNAFSTRTASQIIQESFNPGESNQASGPLFGVQFSQLACSDVTVIDPTLVPGIPTGANLTVAGLHGPRPLPLGLSADPGGLPIFKSGDPVGGIGIEFDGEYRLDRVLNDTDFDPEEAVALTATLNFEIPEERAGDRIFVLGKSLRTTDVTYDDLAPLPQNLPAIDPGQFVPVPLFFDGNLRAGSRFGDVNSGIVKVNRAGVPGAILVDGAGNARFPTIPGTPLADGSQLTTTEVDALLDSILNTAFRTRAAIRRPLDTQAHVTIWVVDTEGIPLGMVRTFDGPIFGIDVALQKGRTATFFSSADAGDRLDEVRARNAVGAFEDYVGAARELLGIGALRGANAFSDRAGGNLSRPFFPDGIFGRQNGPFSLPFPGTEGAGRTWSPFNTGLQLDLVFQRLAQPLGIPVSPPPSIPDTCTDSGVLGKRLANGIQIFPGSVPVYRGNTLIGGVGISGDGVDQDDLIAFYGSSRPGLDFVGHTNVGDPDLGFNAPREIRADQIETPIENIRLRYVNCPESPFVGENTQRVCAGL